jgi:hypothetical protein
VLLTVPNDQTSRQLDSDLEAIENTITKLQRYRELQKTLAQLKGEIDGTESSTIHQRVDRSLSPEGNKEIKLKSIPTFTIDFNIQKRQNWLLDLRHTFKGAPRKYRDDDRKILAAVGFMDETCRQRWYRHVAEKPLEEQRKVESTWQYFEEWTLNLIQNTTSFKADIRGRMERAHQLNGQDPREFHAFLDALEEHFPREAESGRALTFFTKLSYDLQGYIKEHIIVLPETRDGMVSLATHYWELLKQQSNRKRKADETTPNRPRHKYNFRAQEPFRSSRDAQKNDKKVENPAKRDRNPIRNNGNRLRCFNCQSEEHFIYDCPKPRARVQSTKWRQQGNGTEFE